MPNLNKCPKLKANHTVFLYKIKGVFNLKFYLGKVFFLVIFFGYLCNLSAHEMWLEPISFEINKGEKVRAHEKVGQNFKGNKYAYLDSHYEKLSLTINGKTRTIHPRLGSLPAVQVDVDDEGLLVLAAATTPSTITYKDRAIFNQFLKDEGLDWVFAEHENRGLPEIGFTEIYRRYPKSLIKVGTGYGQDKALGLPLEWVAITNPYHQSDLIKLQLLSEGSPYKNAHVSVFNKPQLDSKIFAKTDYFTDQQGMLTVALDQAGFYLINAVKMVQPDKSMSKQYNAVWESLWASMTFGVLLKK